MRPTRRGFLVAGAALFAGCNRRDESGPDRTVTPMAVPQSDGDVLAAAAAIPVPTVPPAPVVSDRHRQAVAGHVEDRLEAAETALESTASVDLEDVAGLRYAENPLEEARAAIARYRESPELRTFVGMSRVAEDLGTIHARVRVETGDLDADAVRASFGAEREAVAGLRGDLGYRLASPLVESLPTVAAGERALEQAAVRRRRIESRVADLSGDPEESTGPIVEARAAIEGLRLLRLNAAGYLRTARDADEPAVESAITAATERRVDGLTSLDVPQRPDGTPLPDRVQTVVSSGRSRRSDVLADDPADPERAGRATLLLDAADVECQLEAYAAAAAATVEHLDGAGFPPDRLEPAKRRAVERVETLASAVPLERRIGHLADDMVAFGDRLEPGQGNDPVASAHFMYVAAGEYAALATRRGVALERALAESAGR